MLSLISRGRFELAIGAGDWPESYTAWGERYPERNQRVARLAETVAALRELWKGQPVTANGPHVRLSGATSTPAPETPPRVVIGAGVSRRTARATIDLADEFNIYADEKVLADVRQLITESGRQVDISLFFDWSWDNWPAEPAAALEPWREKGIDRFFITIGWFDMADRARELAALT